MTKCPKCGTRLHLYNVSQLCPKCKVNLRFCDFEENFTREAKEAELGLARMHVKVRHMKVAFIGSKLSIVRLLAVIFPILGLLVPSGSISLNLPFYSNSFTLSGLGLYTAYSNGEIGYIFKMASSETFSSLFLPIKNIFICYAVVAFFVVAVLLSTILCFISYKNMQKVIAAIACAGLLTSVCMSLVIDHIAKSSLQGTIATAQGGYGLFVEAVMFALVIVANILLIIKKVKVEYEEGDWERYQILLKVKKGEINFDDLPQPIVETAETRMIEEEIKQGLKHFEDEEGRREIEEDEDSDEEEDAQKKEPSEAVTVETE